MSDNGSEYFPSPNGAITRELDSTELGLITITQENIDTTRFTQIINQEAKKDPATPIINTLLWSLDSLKTAETEALNNSREILSNTEKITQLRIQSNYGTINSFFINGEPPDEQYISELVGSLKFAKEQLHLHPPEEVLLFSVFHPDEKSIDGNVWRSNMDIALHHAGAINSPLSKPIIVSFPYSMAEGVLPDRNREVSALKHELGHFVDGHAAANYALSEGFAEGFRNKFELRNPFPLIATTRNGKPYTMEILESLCIYREQILENPPFTSNEIYTIPAEMFSWIYKSYGDAVLLDFYDSLLFPNGVSEKEIQPKAANSIVIALEKALTERSDLGVEAHSAASTILNEFVTFLNNSQKLPIA